MTAHNTGPTDSPLVTGLALVSAAAGIVGVVAVLHHANASTLLENFFTVALLLYFIGGTVAFIDIVADILP